jgi:ubiquinone/menaquinone biosynthesis C-methylase UbiE
VQETWERLYTDQPRLKTQAYANSNNLLARANIYRYQQPHVDLVGWALDQLAWRGGERVLDVGCGPGQYLRRLAQRPRLRLIAMDLSHGMLADLARDWGAAPLPQRAVADVQALPLPDVSCDVALAMHMLYHVPDIERAARELRRVLRPGGVLLAVTNSEEHLAEFSDVMAASIAAISDAPPAKFSRWSSRFGLENGAPLLSSAFNRVERRDVSSQLLIPEAAPILAYVESTRSITEPMLPEGTTWDMLRAEVQRRVAAAIAERGVFHVRTHTGMFICS